MSHEFDELPPAPPPPPAHGQAVATRAVQESEAGPAEDATFNAPQRLCPNCSAPVHGPYCYACGQSEKGMVRHLSEVLSDLSDIVFNVDSRVFRSLFDLYFRPGYLTTEYIAGRRARYVTPFRLFFFLSIIAFFSMQAAIDYDKFDMNVDDGIDSAKTETEVGERVEQRLSKLRRRLDVPGIPQAVRDELATAEAELRAEGAQRVRELDIRAAQSPQDVAARVESNIAALQAGVDTSTSSPSAREQLAQEEEALREVGKKRLRAIEKETAKKLQVGTSLDQVPDAAEEPDRSGFSLNEEGKFTFNGKNWDPASDPVRIGWLPDAINARLTATLIHMADNVRGIREKPSRALSGFISVLPQTLFVLMPLFAVLLKFFYIFKRRLYMEHLLVALHSHAFIFLSLIVILGLDTLEGWAAGTAWITGPLAVLRGIAWAWIFVYLFWMQKRVYRQGWIMTTLKFGVIGNFYLFLLVFAVVLAAIVSLAVT